MNRKDCVSRKEVKQIYDILDLLLEKWLVLGWNGQRDVIRQTKDKLKEILKEKK